MSLGVFPKKFNNLFRSLEFFNPADFSEQVYVENLVSDNIQSTNVLSNNLQSVDAENGDTVSVATKVYVESQVNALIGGSGQLLDTLGEISDALQGDGNFAGHVWNKFGDVDSSLASVNSHLTVLDASGVAVNTRLNAHDSHFTQLDSSGNTFNTRLNAHDTSLNNLASKTNAISYDSASNTTILNSKVSVSLNENLDGNVIIGNASSDTLVVNSATTFAGTVSGLTKATINMNNIDNTSDQNKPISTATQNALNLKSNDNSVVHLSGSETISGTKTFSLAPVLPNNSISNAMINNSSINSGYCDATSSIQTQINARALDSAVVHNSGSESISGQKTFSTGITLNGSDLNTRISGIETLNTSQSSSITSLQQKTSSLSYDSASDTLSLASRISISKDILENGSIYLGDSSGNDIIYIKGTVNANSLNITPVQLSYLSNLSSDVQSQLNTKATTSYVDTSISSLINSAPTALNTLNELATALGNDANYSTTITTALATKAADSTVVHNSGSESISGQKTFSTGITLNGTDLNTRISGIETTNTSQSSSITSLQQKTSSLSYDATSDTLSLASRISLSKDILENGSIYLGDSSGNDVIYVQGNISSSGQVITPAQLGYISGLSSNAQTQITARALDSAVVHNSGSESISGQKTFSTGITLNGTDLNTRISGIETTNSSQTTSINNLNSKTSSLTYDSGTDTLNIASRISISKDVLENGSIYLGDSSGNDVIYVQGNISSASQTITPAQLGFISGLSSNAQTQINSKANDSAVVKLTTDQTIAGIKTFSSAPVLPSSSITNAMINNACISSGYCDATSSIQTQIGTKANDSAVVKLTTDQTIAGIKTFSSAPVLPSNSISNSMINNSCINSGYCDATSSIQTQIGTKANDSAVVKLTTDQTIAGIKTFSSAPVLPSNSITNAMINNSCINSGYCDATSSIQTQIGTKANDSAVVKLTTDQTIAGIKTFSSAPVLPSNSVSNSMINNSCINSGYCDATSSIQTQIGTKATDSLTCHLAGTETITGVKTFSANNTFSGTNSLNLINETVNSVSSITTALSLDYTTCKGINYIQTPTSNFSLAITNVPTGSTNAVYTITLMMAVKYYANSCTVNGTSRTMQFGGGAANVSINASANYVMQQVNVMFLNSSTPIVSSNVLSLF
jgi:exosome complex RNA-binding protein Rrp42 (RNase PH superfamily)